MKKPSAPASVVGTASPFSGEIIEALVKSQRHLVGHFPFPFKSKGKGGGEEAQDGEGRRQKKGQRPMGGLDEPCHVT